METAAERLARAITTEPLTRPVWKWQDWLRTIREVISGPLDWKAEEALLAVTRFNDKLTFAEGSSKPHSMSPEDMLKSLAIQALAQKTGLTHLLEMQRVETTTSSSVLASIVRAAVRDATKNLVEVVGLDVVLDVLKSRRSEALIGTHRLGIGRASTNTVPKSKPLAEQAKQVKHVLYTKYELPWTIGRKTIVNTAVIFEHGLTYLADSQVRMISPEEEPVLNKRAKRRLHA